MAIDPRKLASGLDEIEAMQYFYISMIQQLATLDFSNSFSKLLVPRFVKMQIDVTSSPDKNM